jgi:opacity protein-like surface antigen
MKRILIGIVTVTSLLGTSAFAADLPVKTYTKAPVYVEPVYDWTGFYIGLNGGYNWGNSSNTFPAGNYWIAAHEWLGIRRSGRLQLAVQPELGVRHRG